MLKKTPKKAGQSAFRIYGTYSFVDKDPVIDRMRGPAKDYSYAELERLSGVGASTIYNWFEGQTRRPTYAAVVAVMRAMGFRENWNKKETNG